MRLKPALIMLVVFIVVTGALALLITQLEWPTTAELMDLTEKDLFPGLSPASVKQIEFISPKTGKSPVVLLRVGTHKWRMTKPIDALASDENVSSILRHFAALRSARGYTTNRFEDYELKEPAYRVTVTTDSGSAFTVAFGTEMAGVARAGSEARMDFYTLQEVGGDTEVIPHRYARVADREEVLLVKDDLSPAINVEPGAFRESRLLYRESDGAIDPIGAGGVKLVSITVRGDADKTSSIALAAVKDAGWRVTSPVDARADASTVRDALGETLGLAAADLTAYADDDPKDLAKYGLDKPAVSVELELAAKSEADRPQKAWVRFGSSPKGKDDLVFAQGSSRKSVLVVRKNVLKDRLKADAESFRDRRVVVCAESDVESVTCTYGSGAPKLTVGRRPADAKQWLISEPVSGRAKTSSASDLVSRATGLRVELGGFVSEDGSKLAQYGLDKPQVAVSLKLKGEKKEPAQFLIGSSPKEKDYLVYAKNAAEPSIVLVPKTIVKDLSPDVKTLRETALLEGFDRWSGQEIEITRAGKTVKLAKEEKDRSWKFSEPKGYNADYSAPGDFLAAVADLDIKGWPADKPDSYATYGLDKAYAAVKLKTKPEAVDEFGEAKEETGEAKSFEIHFGAKTKDGNNCYVRLPSESNVYEVKADIIKRIEKGYLEFRNRQALEFDKSRVKSLTVEGGKANYAALKLANGDWLLTKPLPVPADKTNADGLLDALNGLQAKELVCEGDIENPKFGLKAKDAKPHRTVVVVLEQDKPKEEKPKDEKPKDDKKPADDKKPDEKPKEPEKIEVRKNLLIGAPVTVEKDKDPDRYAVVLEDKIVFVLAADDVKKLDKELVTTRVTDVKKADVVRLAIVHRDGSKIELARKGDNWELVSHKDVVPDNEKVEKLVEEAGSITVDSYVAYNQADLAKYGLDKPLLAITVTPKEKAALVVQVGDPVKDPAAKPDDKQPKKYHATGGIVPAIYLLSEDKVKALTKRAEDLQKEKPKE